MSALVCYLLRPGSLAFTQLLSKRGLRLSVAARPLLPCFDHSANIGNRVSRSSSISQCPREENVDSLMTTSTCFSKCSGTSFPVCTNTTGTCCEAFLSSAETSEPPDPVMICESINTTSTGHAFSKVEASRSSVAWTTTYPFFSSSCLQFAQRSKSPLMARTWPFISSSSLDRRARLITPMGSRPTMVPSTSGRRCNALVELT